MTRDGTAKPVSRDQILRRERGEGNTNFPCSADHVQDWQPHPVDPYSCYVCDHTYIHKVGLRVCLFLDLPESHTLFFTNLCKTVIHECA